MAARQKATRHELEDGFVAVWDSSEIDEDLRQKLIDLADRPLDNLIAGIGGEAPAVREADSPRIGPAAQRSPARRRRRAAAA